MWGWGWGVVGVHQGKNSLKANQELTALGGKWEEKKQGLIRVSASTKNYEPVLFF